METPRPPTGRCYRFFYLLLVGQIIMLSNCQDALLGTSASGYSCTPECVPGFECVLGHCQRQQCETNCSGDPTKGKEFCASDGNTYDSMCELERAKCELQQDITVEYTGACVTLPPPPEPVCTVHQREYEAFFKTKEHAQLCFFAGMQKKNNGTLTLADALMCYKPQCDQVSHQYLVKQCSTVFLGYCWCSTYNGYAIEGTFQKDMPTDYCLNRQKCVVNEKEYDDGEIFYPPNECGLCECIDGNYTCFVEYDVNNSGLSEQETNNLIDELIQIFNFQYNHNDHIQADIRQIRNFPTRVSDAQKEKVLGWKFEHYNRNEDNGINKAEEFIFHTELSHFFRCPALYQPLSELMDKDRDQLITMLEWKSFFGLPSGPSGPVKRDTPLLPRTVRKPLHLRKKFHYVLY